MNVLVTGGAGYIGQFCVRALLDARHQVITLDRSPAPDWQLQSCLVVQGDINDQQLLSQVMADSAPLDAVLHLAADKSVPQSLADPGRHFRNNVGGSLTLFEAMRRAGVRRVVFSSSAAVYGSPDKLPVSEDAALRPENPYGAGKQMVEQMLHWYHVCHGFRAVTLRYFNAAGAAPDGSLGEDWTGSDNLLPRVMRALLGDGEPVPVYGSDFPTPDGTAIRDYVHVEDLARAHLRALQWLLDSDNRALTINLGTGKGVSVREMLAAAERVSGIPVPHLAAARRKGDPPAVWADVTAAANVLGWQARLDVGDIVATAWGWHSGGRRSARPG